MNKYNQFNVVWLYAAIFACEGAIGSLYRLAETGLLSETDNATAIDVMTDLLRLTSRLHDYE